MISFLKLYFIIWAAGVKGLGGQDCEEGCLCPLNQTTGMSDEMLCTKIPSNPLPRGVKTLKVQGEINKLRKDLFLSFTQITYLDLSSCHITEIQSSALSTMSDLTILRLSNNLIEFITEDNFSNLTRLEELYLNGNDIKVIIDGSFKNLESLKILNLGDNKLLEMPEQLPSTLRELYLQNNEIERLSMERLSNLVQLETFKACGNEINSWPEMKFWPNLKKLYLGDKVLTATANHLPDIKNLHLSARSLHNARISESLTDTISLLKSLQTLFLENYEVNSYRFLTRLSKLTSLQLQNINYTAQDIPQFPSNITSLTIIGSFELAHRLLNTSTVFNNLNILRLMNNSIEVINREQSEHLMKSAISLDITSNPLNCTAEKWTWLINKIKINKYFLRDGDKVTCYTPHSVKGRKLLEVITLPDFTTKERPYEINAANLTGNYTRTRNTTTTEIDIFHGIIMFLTIVTFFLIILACFKKTTIISKIQAVFKK